MELRNANDCLSSVQYSKSGFEIRGQLRKRIESVQARLQAREEENRRILEKRSFTVEEILGFSGAMNFDVFNSTYANKRMSQGFTVDMFEVNTLREEWKVLERNHTLNRNDQEELGNLRRIDANVESDRKFDLTFEEITYLGF